MTFLRCGPSLFRRCRAADGGSGGRRALVPAPAVSTPDIASFHCQFSCLAAIASGMRLITPLSPSQLSPSQPWRAVPRWTPNMICACITTMLQLSTHDRGASSLLLRPCCGDHERRCDVLERAASRIDTTRHNAQPLSSQSMHLKRCDAEAASRRATPLPGPGTAWLWRSIL